MILSDVDLRNEISQGRISVAPLGPRAIQPASIDVRLGEGLLESIPSLGVPGAGWAPRDCLQGYTLLPGSFVLGTTMETVSVPPDLCCMVSGRSSTGRWGLVVEIAGWVDPGFHGEVTLELTNISRNPIRLTAGMGIAQLVFWRMTTAAQVPYGSTPSLGSRYQGQAGPTPAREH